MAIVMELIIMIGIIIRLLAAGLKLGPKTALRKRLPSKFTKKTVDTIAIKNSIILFALSLKAGYFFLRKIMITLMTSQLAVAKNSDILQPNIASKSGISLKKDCAKRKSVMKLRITIPAIISFISSKPRYLILFSLFSNFMLLR